ncbi:hypothetical protein Acr_22g0001940 [Actinidia rufa]|uniref:Retrovirus-related Pol polyprotein from transposon TNT 1-94-like beta-barrel domain-containing protein n=1 Tax=Actinidia rufa TaxID=165716 RepID=A0A7J0GJ09_9ERIC|nr:hypothetical protein Acr_22g0001940 [Actinidia rufa]
MVEHTSKFQNLVNQLTSVDLQFDDEMQVLLLLSSLSESWDSLVVSLSNSALNRKLTTSMVIDAIFNEEARRRDIGTIDQSESQVLVSEGSWERGRGQGRCHHRGIEKAVTTVMAVDEDEIDVLLVASEDGKLDWVLDLDSAYHLCRDREMFSTYVACEGRVWMANNTASRVVGKGSVRFHMADGRSMILIETRGLYRLEGTVQTWGATVRHESSGISEKNGQGKQPLHRDTQSKRIVHPSGGGWMQGHFSEKEQGTLVWRYIHFSGKWSSLLMRLRYLGCYLVDLMGS